jgi:hypothetical protein
MKHLVLAIVIGAASVGCQVPDYRGDRAAADKAAADEAAARHRAEDIAVIAAVPGISEQHATILTDAGFTFPDPLSTTAVTDIIIRTSGKVGVDEAKKIVEAVKAEVAARDQAVKEKAATRRLKAIRDFASLAGINLAKAQKIYDDGIFESFEELDAATTVELRDAGLAEDKQEAEELEKEIDDEGMARAERKAVAKEAEAKEAAEKAAFAREAAADAADAADAAETAAAEAADVAAAARAAAPRFLPAKKD